MPIPSNNAQWSAELRNKSDVQGKVGLAIDEIVVPTVLLGEDFPELVWDGIASGWCWGGQTTAQPAAGQNRWVWLRNPDNSGVVAVVRNIYLNLEAGALPIQQTAAFQVTGSFVSNPQTARAVTDLRRTRRIGAQDTVLELHSADQAGPMLFPQRLASMQSPANGSDRYDFSTHIYLAPGTSLACAAQQTDQRLSVWFQWEERILRTAERVVRQP